MDAWVLALSLGVSFICIALQITYRGVLYGIIGGMVTFLTLARLIADNTVLIIGHECCNAGADVPVSLSQNDTIIVALILSAFVCLQFSMVIEMQLDKNDKAR